MDILPNCSPSRQASLCSTARLCPVRPRPDQAVRPSPKQGKTEVVFQLALSWFLMGCAPLPIFFLAAVPLWDVCRLLTGFPAPPPNSHVCYLEEPFIDQRHTTLSTITSTFFSYPFYLRFFLFQKFGGDVVTHVSMSSFGFRCRKSVPAMKLDKQSLVIQGYDFRF